MCAAISAHRDVVRLAAQTDLTHVVAIELCSDAVGLFQGVDRWSALLTRNRVEECVREADHEPGRIWVFLQRSTESMGDDVA